MRTVCIACNEWYFYNDGDEDCTKFVCSWCMGADPQKMLGKWSRLRFRILQRDGFTCKYCGDSPLKNNICKLHVDHIRAVSQFGTNAETNLITACAVCNIGKLAFELNNEAKEKVNEYINGTDIGAGTGQESTSTWTNEVEDSKGGGGELADGVHVGEGYVQAVTREDELITKSSHRKKELGTGICIHCNNVFQQSLRGKKYCSNICRTTYWNIKNKSSLTGGAN